MPTYTKPYQSRPSGTAEHRGTQTEAIVSAGKPAPIRQLRPIFATEAPKRGTGCSGVAELPDKLSTVCTFADAKPATLRAAAGRAGLIAAGLGSTVHAASHQQEAPVACRLIFRQLSSLVPYKAHFCARNSATPASLRCEGPIALQRARALHEAAGKQVPYPGGGSGQG